MDGAVERTLGKLTAGRTRLSFSIARIGTHGRGPTK
jgi:hypothetical protein